MSDKRTDELAFIQRLFRERKIDRRTLMQAMAAAGAAGVVGGTSTVVSTRSASAQADSGNLLTVSTQQQPTWIRNFNPLLSQDTSRWPTQSGIYEPLAVFNEITGELVPWLGTEWSFNADNTALTITTRDGVSWSDGTPFTAKDVVFTINYMKEHDDLPGTEGFRSVVQYLGDVTAPDDSTVVVNFAKVYTPGLYDVLEQNIVPEHIWKDIANPGEFLNEEPVGTGPFNVIGRFEDQIYEVLKNPTYWQEGKPLVDGFRFPAYPSNDAAQLALLNGEVDMASNFVPDIQKTFIDKDPEHFQYWFPSTGTDVHLYTNTTRAPFDDVNVRKAISMAIDREQIVAVAMYDYTHPADSTGLSDSFESWKDATAAAGEWVKQDVDAANALLDAAGLAKDGDWRKLPDGTAMSYDINVVSGWSDWVSSCQIMSKNLEDIGIQTKVQTYDFSAWYDRVSQGDFDLSIGWSSPGPTPFNYYRGVMATSTAQPIGTSGAENWHRFASPEADALLEQFAATADDAEQKSIAIQLQMLFSENAPAIPLFPGPQWAEFNTMRFTNFPSAENPYVIPSTYQNTDRLILITEIKPQAAS